MRSPMMYRLLRSLLGGTAAATTALLIGGCPIAGGASGGLYGNPSDQNSADGPVDDGTPVSFAQDIQPILSTYCAGCHVSGGLADREGIALRLVAGQSYGGLVNQRSVQDDSFTLVVPGDSSQSLMWMKVSMDDPPVGARMPFQLPPLDDARIELIRRWIDEGALDN